MMKRIVVVLVLSLTVLLFAGCNEENTVVIPHLHDDLPLTEEVMEVENEDNHEPSVTQEEEPPEVIQLAENVIMQEPTEQLPREQSVPQTTPTPQATPTPTPRPTQTQTSTATPAPTQTQTPAPTPPPQQQSQTPQTTPAPQQTPEPPPPPPSAPTPQPTPPPAPQPAPPPAPQPVREPPPARTICNTCGADITGNVAGHGTIHLLNDEDFSYRVE